MDAIQESISKLQQLFTQRMDNYQSDLQASTPSSTISNLSADFSSFRTFIMTSLQSLQEQIQLLAHQTDCIEMRSRRKMLMIHGVQEQKQEDTAAITSKTITGQLKLEFCISDIARCHRMGRLTSQDRPRPILVKFRSMEMRGKVWRSKTALKGSGITVSEFLTKPRHDAFMEARKRFGITRCWTRDGCVYILSGDGVRHRITSIPELDKIASMNMPKASATAKETTTAPKTRKAANKK